MLERGTEVVYARRNPDKPDRVWAWSGRVLWVRGQRARVRLEGGRRGPFEKTVLVGCLMVWRETQCHVGPRATEFSV